MGDQQELTDSNLGPDFISHLPQPIKDNILGRLHSEQVVRTCVLSKEWRYAWCTVPNLVTIEDSIIVDCSEYVNMLLSNHQGPIHGFTLRMDDPDFDDLDRWINVLGSKGVKDLDLFFDSTDEDHEIPPSIFSCLLDLTDLKLRDCILNMPQTFGGFKLLRNMELDLVSFIRRDLEKLVSSCPLLEDLKLVDEENCLGNLVIRSQSLQKLTVFGDFINLLIDAPMLFSLYTSPEEYGDFDTIQGEYRTTFSVYVIHCRFTLRYHMDSTERKLPIQLNHLNGMILTIDLSNEAEHASALCLFKIVPRLGDLYVKFTSGEGSPCTSFWESENGDDLFSSLKTIDISSIEADNAVFILGFVAFILRTAPVLEKMIIRDLGVDAVMRGMKTPHVLQKVSQNKFQQKVMRLDLMTIFKVLTFPRLSNKATVEFTENNAEWLNALYDSSSDSFE